MENSRDPVERDCCRILLAIILPPLGVYFETGCDSHFFICLILTILGYVPGLVYAIYIIASRPDFNREKMADSTSTDFCRILCSVIIPPIGVFMETGCSLQLLICIILTLLGYIPGLIYAIYIITQK
uniref:Uncharacterized protein n=1 Tax=Panagrolaimus sp. JU765 TaxID=591449 RepID=A0AC34QNH7_9BILA